MPASASPTCIGVDPTGGRPPFCYAALDADLRLLALGTGRLADVLAFLAGQHRALVALNAPPRPAHHPDTADPHPPAAPPRRSSTPLRPVEHDLRTRNLPIYLTPARAADAPPWMRRAFALYQRLDELGYRPHPHPEAPRQWLEVPAEAAFTALLGHALLPAHRLEGRWQRQILLADAGLGIQDPMRFFEEITRHRLRRGQLPLHLIHTPGELNALVAAYTAWLVLHHPEQVLALGDPATGQVFIPQGQVESAV